MKIENVAKIKVDPKQKSVVILLEHCSGDDAPQIYLVWKDLRINVEGNSTVEVFQDERKYNCKRCNGKGFVYVDMMVGTDDIEQETCTACKGTGKSK